MNKIIFVFATAMLVAGCKEQKSTAEQSGTEARRAHTQSAKEQAEETPIRTLPSKADGERFLAENAKKEGVKVTASGLQYEVLQEGTGRRPKVTDKVSCHYEGRFITGHVFDSSYRHGSEPRTFPMNGVITGWMEGLQLMREGAKYRFVIPPHLAYGAEGMPGAIPPFSTLIFDIELVRVQ